MVRGEKDTQPDTRLGTLVTAGHVAEINDLPAQECGQTDAIPIDLGKDGQGFLSPIFTRNDFLTFSDTILGQIKSIRNESVMSRYGSLRAGQVEVCF